ncbi:MAG: hypothetical protein ACPGJI_10045 [Kangiellaceae bacterium]
MNINIVHQGRGGYIEVGNYHFEIEMQVGEPHFCIYFPRRSLDRSLNSVQKEIEALIAEEPEKWELAEYDAHHGFYNAMTVNERLFVSGLADEFDTALEQKNTDLVRKILVEVEVPESSIEEILKNA